MTKRILSYLLLASLLLFAGCATQVKRVEADRMVDLSGRWNDTDSRMVAEEMIQDSLSRPWMVEFQRATGKRPVVVVGLVQNKTHELIAVDTFIKDIEREFINSGKVRVIQAGQLRDELRSERAGQQENASPETVKRWGQELGADFILQGVVNSIVDQSRNQKLVFFQVDLGLANVESTEQVWLGSKEIKKLISR